MNYHTATARCFYHRNFLLTGIQGTPLKADSAGVFLTVFSILLFIRVCNHVFSDPDTRRHVPRYIRASRAVACDNLPLRASVHLGDAVPFCLTRKLRQEYRHSAGVFTSVTIFRSPVVFFYERYPFGFLDCQFHASRHISSSVLFASQPSSTFAFVASE